MNSRVGLEMNEQGTLMVTYTCAECHEKQVRAFRQTRPNEAITCCCGLEYVLTPQAFGILEKQVNALRDAFQRVNGQFGVTLETTSRRVAVR